MKYEINIREEELKNKVAKDYFSIYDWTQIIGDVDFCVAIPQNTNELFEQESLFWAEAKKGISDVYKSLVQLILTIGKARTFDKYLPPLMLGAFDAKKIAFIQYNDIHDIFYLNDFNWNVAPSDHETKEFKLVYDKVKDNIDKNTLLFYYENDDSELKKFIKANFVASKFGFNRIRIDKNNFLVIYYKWLQAVKSSIAVNWDIVKKTGIIDGDFYLADLLSLDNETLKEKLFVLLKKNKYELDRKIEESGMFSSKTVSFNDNQKAHNQFWNKYERPPKEEYWDYIVKRRDLLVPQDVRERKGSFFTPQIWVELSQKYIADVLGKDWQDEYYIWDCAAGTGNLLAGLTSKYNIWASTLDKQDVEVMKDRIKNGANLLEDHVFQFDFLNDEFSKLPKTLLKIINDPEKRKKLVVYINPPYAEASSYGKGSIPQVANETKVFHNFKDITGAEAMNEIFAQFFVKIYNKIPDAKIASFCTPKYITSRKFNKFRNYFKVEYQKGFICKANTFDNVKGDFPIGFFIFNLSIQKILSSVKTDVYSNDKELREYNKIGKKYFRTITTGKSIADWRKTFYDNNGGYIGSIIIVGPSMQSNRNTFITNYPAESYMKKRMVAKITKINIIKMSVYLSVRQCIKQSWINNKDHLKYPIKKWEKDENFHNDCLAFTLFHSQNKISSKEGTNHWIPFTELEVNSREKFDSNFMTKFINGKIEIEKKSDIYNKATRTKTKKLLFSAEAKAVFNAGRELWYYYHAQPNCNVNASLYDIKAYFQGRNAKGRMNSKSSDTTYTELLTALKANLKILSKIIEPKIYEYGFLKKQITKLIINN